MRAPSIKCIACGPQKTITDLTAYDYDAFCSGSTAAGQVQGVDRVSAKVSVYTALCQIPLTTQEYAEQAAGPVTDRLLIDTRPSVEFGICSLPGSTSAYYSQATILSHRRHPPRDDLVRPRIYPPRLRYHLHLPERERLAPGSGSAARFTGGSRSESKRQGCDGRSCGLVQGC